MMRFLAILLLIASVAQADSGSDKYTPTKLEWMWAHLSTLTMSFSLAKKGASFSAAIEPPNTLVIKTYISDALKKADTLEACALMETEVTMLAKIHGWDWLKIRQEFVK